MLQKSTANLATGLAVAAVAALFTSCEPGAVSEKPPIHINPNMDYQEKYKAQAESPFFEDGRTMRTPIEGTVARRINDNGTVNPVYDGHKTDLYEGKTADGKWSEMPAITDLGFASKEELIKRGEERYEIYCTPCHGSDGTGNGSVASNPANKSEVAGSRFPGVANLTNAYRSTNEKDGFIYAYIKNGGPIMPSYSYQVEKEDRWAITAYVRELQTKAAAGASTDTADAGGVSVEAGQKIYQAQCFACHGTGVGPAWNGLFGKTDHKIQNGIGGPVETVAYDEAYVTESIKNPNAKISVKPDGSAYPPAMPPQALSDDQIKSVIEYMKTLK